MTTHQTITSITTEQGQPVNAHMIHTIWHDHVNRWTWIGMGVKPGTMIGLPDGLMMDIYLGAGKRKRRLVIKLNQADLYDIEIGRLHTRTFEWIIVGQTRSIHAEDLDQAIRDLYDTHKI